MYKASLLNPKEEYSTLINIYGFKDQVVICSISFIKLWCIRYETESPNDEYSIIKTTNTLNKIKAYYRSGKLKHLIDTLSI